MTKVLSYTICFYGSAYLDYSLRSVAPFVDHSFILYTPHASHGHSNPNPPIESKQQLKNSISSWDKITWIDTNQFYQEGPQRDYAVNRLTELNADIILVLDADEVWAPEMLEKSLIAVEQTNSRQFLVNMYHFWRSFSYVCTDDGWPVRFIKPKVKEGTSYISPTEFGRVYHFGYAISDVLMNYKWQSHGHKNELRPEWFREKWSAWPPVDDCHPTNGRKADGTGWWDPKPFNKYDLPEVLHKHPYFNLDKIE